MKRVGILVVSDRAAKGEYADRSGPAIRDWAIRMGFDVVNVEVIPDEMEAIARKLKDWADSLHLELILTTGGTGLGPRDVTPEATRAVIERETPGIPERIRLVSGLSNPHASLSRALAGLRGKTLIVNLPGNPKAVEEWLRVLEPLLAHAFDMIEGKGHEDGSEEVHSWHFKVDPKTGVMSDWI
jgi:molybdenum cofactor synthesis domain-containing protein